MDFLRTPCYCLGDMQKIPTSVSSISYFMSKISFVQVAPWESVSTERLVVLISARATARCVPEGPMLGTTILHYRILEKIGGEKVTRRVHLN